MNALTEEVAERGYGDTSIAGVSARVGLSEEVFRANFADKEECFIAAFDSLVHQLVAHTISAYHAPREQWSERLRAGLVTCIAGICTRSAAARAYMLEAPVISRATRAHRALAIALFEETIAEMLEDVPAPAELSQVTVTGITGGIWRVVEGRLREDRAAELPGLVEGLLAWTLAYIPESSAPAEPVESETGLAGELTAGAITEIVERDGRESARELAYLALAPVIGHDRAIATRRKVVT